MKELLLVGVGLMGRPYVRAARRLGVRVRAVETEARVDEFRSMVDVLHTTRGTLDESWAEAACAAAAHARPDGIIAFTEWQVIGAALVQDRLGLAGPSLHASLLSRNKALQRGVFAAAGVAQPEYTMAATLPEAREWALARLPVVIKPLSSAGSEGVELVATPEEFDTAAARRADEGTLLVEAAVSGQEYSWEGFVCDGKVWFGNLTEKETTGAPYFVEVAHRAGVRLDAERADQVDRLTTSVLAAMGMRTGIVHLEFRLTDTGPVLMEVAVRTPGGFIMDLLELAWGFDPYEILVRMAVGMPLPPAPTAMVSRAGAVLPVTPCGRITAIDGLDEVRAHPHVVQAGLWTDVGGIVEPTPSGLDRPAYVVISAPDADSREEAMATVFKTLHVHTEPVR